MAALKHATTRIPVANVSTGSVSVLRTGARHHRHRKMHESEWSESRWRKKGVDTKLWASSRFARHVSRVGENEGDDVWKDGEGCRPCFDDLRTTAPPTTPPSLMYPCRARRTSLRYFACVAGFDPPRGLHPWAEYPRYFRWSHVPRGPCIVLDLIVMSTAFRFVFDVVIPEVCSDTKHEVQQPAGCGNAMPEFNNNGRRGCLPAACAGSNQLHPYLSIPNPFGVSYPQLASTEQYAPARQTVASALC